MPNVKIDPTNHPIGQEQTKEISNSGAAEVVSESGIETVPGPGFESLAELEKFMNEEVKVMLFPPSIKGEEFVAQLGVNGKHQFVIRGMPVWVKRKYIEVLARSRRVNVQADGYKDGGNGEAKNIVNITNSLQYPFQVLEDKNPKGGPWLSQILQEN